MRAQIRLKLLGFFLLTVAIVAGPIWVSHSAGQEPVPGTPEAPEVVPVAPPEKPEVTVPSEAVETEPVIVGVPVEGEAQPVPGETIGEAVIVGVPVEGQPTATILQGLPASKGPKKSIAVLDFENRSGFAAEWTLGDGMADMLTTALVQTNRFIVVERPKIREILQEQDLAASGRTAAVPIARVGKLIPAQIGVTGAITEFSFEQQRTGLGLEYEHVAVGFVTGAAHVGLNLRMVDTTSGQVLFSERVEKKATFTGIEGEYTNKSFAIGGEHFQKTPLGKATHQALTEAVFRIALNMQKVPWKGSIVLAQPNQIIINCGKREGIVPGQKFVVYSKGEELTDPDTGEILGVVETRAGRVSVVDVQEKFSIATIEEGESFNRGDVLRLQ